MLESITPKKKRKIFSSKFWLLLGVAEGDEDSIDQLDFELLAKKWA